MANFGPELCTLQQVQKLCAAAAAGPVSGMNFELLACLSMTRSGDQAAYSHVSYMYFFHRLDHIVVHRAPWKASLPSSNSFRFVVRNSVDLLSGSVLHKLRTIVETWQ